MRRAFTLVECMVVIAIILVVAGITFPVIARAKQGASKSRCVSNLRQIAVAVNIYAADCDGSPMAGGDRITMGLPGHPNALRLDRSLWTCNEPPSMGLKAAYTVFFGNEGPGGAAAWKKHVDKMGTRAILVLDNNHGDPRWRHVEHAMHSAFAAQVDTAIRTVKRRGSPGAFEFWED